MFVEIASEGAFDDIRIEIVERGRIGIAQASGDGKGQPHENLFVGPGERRRFGDALLKLQCAVAALDDAGALGVGQRRQEHVCPLQDAVRQKRIDDHVERASQPPHPMPETRHVARHLRSHEQEAIQPVIFGHARDGRALRLRNVALRQVEHARKVRAVLRVFRIQIEDQATPVEAEHQLARGIRLAGDAHRARAAAADVARQEQQIEVRGKAIGARALVDPHARHERGPRALSVRERFRQERGVLADGGRELGRFAVQRNAFRDGFRGAAIFLTERAERRQTLGRHGAREIRRILPALLEDHAAHRQVQHDVAALAKTDVERSRVDRLKVADRVGANRIDHHLHGVRIALQLFVGLGKRDQWIGAV